jgi:hypothetical protein
MRRDAGGGEMGFGSAGASSTSGAKKKGRAKIARPLKVTRNRS